MKKQAFLTALLFAFTLTAMSQSKTLGLDEAIQLGVQNSKQLKLSQSKIDQAVSELEQ